MLLCEILSKPIPNLKTSKVRINPRWDDNQDKLLSMGKPGLQSKAMYHSPSRSVVKHTNMHMQQEDPSYQFLRLALQHQDNPYFPKVHKIKGYDINGRTTQTVSKMERLYPMAWDDVKKFLTVLGIDPHPYGSFDTIGLNNSIYANFKKPEWRVKYASRSPDANFKKALRLLEPLFRHYGPDMHFDNVMVRGNGEIVLLDPVTYAET